ncbi:MAG: DUF86 domain-containing protein [Caulobacterales bacterium]|jgi:uncharacterized protein with HEPN domain
MLEEDRLRLTEIAARCALIEGWVEESEESAFQTDQMRRDAIAMSLLVIGETARRLSDTVKSSTSHVPWPAIVSLRNRIAHGYETVDAARVWQIAAHDIPALHASVLTLLASA